jgi:TonB family protein
MNIADLFDQSRLLTLLVETTMAGSTALLLVMLVRRPLRNMFGAAVAYAAWTLVPAAVIAVLLPAATVAVENAPAVATLSAAAMPMATVPAVAPIDVTVWLFAIWLAGVVAMVAHLARQQRAFRRRLGRLQVRADGLQQAESVAGLPAALGLLRPTIVVPSDFDTRYSFEERELMHAHERSHIARGDLHTNALVAALRSVFWFNPLLHYATRHFRHDQELACDQRVIARHPNARRSYGEAMFKTQLAAQQPLPIGCHWGYSHPLKERIAMLKQPVPTFARWVGGSALVFFLAVGVGFTAWSAQPKREVLAARELPAGTLMTRMTLSVDAGTPQQFAMVSKAGESFAMRTEQAGQQWEVHATATPLGNGTIALDTTLSRDGKVVGSPKLLVKDGNMAAIKIGESNAGSGAFEGITMEMMVTAAASPVPPAPPVSPTPPSAMSAPTPMAPPAPPRAPSDVSATPRAAPPAPALPPHLQGIAPPAPPSPPGALPALAPPPAPPAPPARLKKHIAPPAPPAREAPVNQNAAAQGAGRRVLLLVDVDANGQPTHVEVQDSQLPASFEEAAVSVVRKWTFTPAVTNGSKVAAQMRVPFVFEAFDSMPARGAGVHCDVALSLGPSGPHYCGRGR